MPEPACHLTSAADLDAAIARVTPDAGPARGRRARAEVAIVAALAVRHPKDEVTLTLMRLDVLGQLVEIDGNYTLPAAEEE